MRKKAICEVSARHFHPDYEILGLHKKRDLSQGGHWAAEEKVEAHGMKFTIVMPPRPKPLYEVSLTDWYTHMQGPPQFEGEICIKLRHFHCDKKTAEEWGIEDGDKISVQVGGIRAGRLDQVLVRVDEWSVPRVHLDTDEANALFIKNGDEVELIIGED